MRPASKAPPGRGAPLPHFSPYFLLQVSRSWRNCSRCFFCSSVIPGRSGNSRCLKRWRTDQPFEASRFSFSSREGASAAALPGDRTAEAATAATAVPLAALMNPRRLVPVMSMLIVPFVNASSGRCHPEGRRPDRSRGIRRVCGSLVARLGWCSSG